MARIVKAVVAGVVAVLMGAVASIALMRIGVFGDAAQATFLSDAAIVERDMRAVLIDPKSGAFRDVAVGRTFRGERVACGELNGRNRLGGHAGWRPFAGIVIGEGSRRKFIPTHDENEPQLSSTERAECEQVRNEAHERARTSGPFWSISTAIRNAIGAWL